MKYTVMGAKTVSFLLIFALMFQGTTKVLVNTHDGTKRRQSGFYQEEKNSLDVVVVGASSTYPFYSPGLAFHNEGYKSYTYATPGMQINQIIFALKEIKKTQNPKLYVIDLRSSIYASPEYDEVEVRRLTDNMPLLSTNRLSAIKNLVDDDDKLPFVFSIMKYHSRWNEVNKTDWNTLLEKKDPAKGFESYKTNLSFDVDESLKKPGTATKSFGEESEKTVRQVLKYCKDNKLPVLFTTSVWVPSTGKIQKLNYLGSIVKEYGFDFLNLNAYVNEIGIDYKTDMRDKSHVNTFGAYKHTKFLANYIASHYDLPDHRNESGIDEWNTAYELFVEDFNQMKEKFPNVKTTIE